MEKVIEHSAICKFCGEKRTTRTIEDDGADWLGHKRGSFTSKNIDEGCSCKLGKIEKEKISIKKMCHNCMFFKDGNCTCRKMLDEINGMFQMPKGLWVKHPERCCKHWEINLEIFKALIKDD